MVPWTHPSPQPKRHLDRFSRFLESSLVWHTDRPRYSDSVCNSRPHLRT